METSPPAPSAVSHLNKQREEPILSAGVTALESHCVQASSSNVLQINSTDYSRGLVHAPTLSILSRLDHQ